MKKLYIQEQDLLEDAYRLGVQIFESGFKPDFIVGLWRGGSTVGIYVQECLQYLGIETDHIAVRTSYQGMNAYFQTLQSPQDIRVHGLQYLYENINCQDCLLIVDDVFSTGQNIEALINRLQQKSKRNMPGEIRIAVPYYKPSQNKTGRIPDFYLHETDHWLVLPYELKDLSPDEIKKHKPWVLPILDQK